MKTMKRAAATASLLVTALLLAAPAASQTASDSITVTAANVTSFTFAIAGSSFDFGTVNANGTTSSTGVTGVRNGTNTGAIYTRLAATTWTCTASGLRTVRIFNSSSVASITWGNANRLRMRIPATGIPAPANSCGFKTFTAVGDGGTTCGAGNLLRRMSVGTGAPRSGNLDFRLLVQDVDVPGANTWTVLLTAASS